MANKHDDGLGLEYGTVRLERSRVEWRVVAKDLVERATQALGRDAIGVEHIGSTAVPGLLAKPIVDIVVGVGRQSDLRSMRRSLEALGWTYRGDAGGDGGHVFVLERSPQRRMAHLHIVEHGEDQWRRYLVLRDRLQNDPAARSAYERAKVALIGEQGTDNRRRAYTKGKAAIINELLADSAEAEWAED